MSFFVSCGKAPTPETHFKYEVEFGRATITEFDPEYQGDVIIPEKLGGYTVTHVGEASFRECDALTSVTIPDSVSETVIDAFTECESLAAITLPSSVTKIGKEAFSFCDALTAIKISNSVTSIGRDAFWACNKPTIHAPDGSYAEQYAKENRISFVAE